MGLPTSAARSPHRDVQEVHVQDVSQSPRETCWACSNLYGPVELELTRRGARVGMSDVHTSRRCRCRRKESGVPLDNQGPRWIGVEERQGETRRRIERAKYECRGRTACRRRRHGGGGRGVLRVFRVSRTQVKRRSADLEKSIDWRR